MIEKMSDEQITSASRRMAEVLYQMSAMVGYGYKIAFTIAAYAVMYFVVYIAKNAQLDEHQEVRNLAKFISDVAKIWGKETDIQKGAS